MSLSEELKKRLLISDQIEIEELGQQLADKYVDYFDIDDIDKEQERYQDSIEECLAHLEEVMSALDCYKQQSSETVDNVLSVMVGKKDTLNRLFGQVDALEQYVFETNQLLDELDTTMQELERHQNSKDSRIKQILHMIPGLSNMPRLGLFSSLSGLLIQDDSSRQSFVESQSSNLEDNEELLPIGEILERIKQVDVKLNSVTTYLNKRLQSSGGVEPNIEQSSEEIHEPMASLSLDSPGHVDGSWQELL